MTVFSGDQQARKVMLKRAGDGMPRDCESDLKKTAIVPVRRNGNQAAKRAGGKGK